jgi:hypothetical protein
VVKVGLFAELGVNVHLCGDTSLGQPATMTCSSRSAPCFAPVLLRVGAFAPSTDGADQRTTPPDRAAAETVRTASDTNAA